MVDLLFAEIVTPSPWQIGASLAVYALLACGLAVWVTIVARWSKRENALAPSGRRPVPWRGVEVLLVMGMLMSGPVIVAISGEGMPAEAERPGTSEIAASLVATASLSLALAALVTAALVFMRGATAADLGVIGRPADDLRYGALGWLAALVPVYALQSVLVAILPPEDRQQHPLIDLLAENPSAEVVVLVVLTAVVVAPVVEEFLFRVLLQGWLEKVFGPRPSVIVAEEILVDEPVLAEALPAVEASVANPFASPEVTEATPTPPAEKTADPLPPALPSFRAAIPIAISSALFAAAHANVWPDPLPLFVLALVLGYLYHQTHRLWPGVVMHMLFNGLSLGMVWMQ